MKTNIEELNIEIPREGKRIALLARGKDGHTVGTLSLKLQRPVADFSVLYVADGCRRKGIGRNLIERAATLAKAAGCVGLSCAVNALNFDAQKFYASVGFIPAYQFQDGDFLFTLQLNFDTKAKSA